MCEEEYEVHLALINWARWCRVREVMVNAGSAEGRYITPRYRELSAIFSSHPDDVIAAEQVGLALLTLPSEFRKVLFLRYWERISDWSICRRLRLHATSFGAFMRMARVALRRALAVLRKRLQLLSQRPFGSGSLLHTI
jgi:DNA-directed RNA polymerase specialized sigma24 family protein